MKTNLPVTNIEIPFAKGRYIVSRTDPKGIITYADDTFIEMSGFNRDELLQKNHNIVRHPDMPPQAFEWLWDTIRTGRPWRGTVKNRQKNGNHYWADALVVPVRHNHEITGFLSVRTEPSREQISEADALYKKLNANQTSLPKPSGWSKIAVRTKLNGLVIGLMATQLFGALIDLIGPKVELSAENILLGLQIFGVTAIGITFLLMALQRTVLNRIERITNRLNRIAQGDLTDAIPLGRPDELGELNDSVITMQTHFKAMISEISESAQLMVKNADSLNTEMEATRKVAENQSDAVSSIAAAVEQLVASAHEVAESAEHAAKIVEVSRGLINEASSSMVESQTASQNVVSTVNGASQTMADLFQSIFAIGQISQAIRGIADQTNLLALNAAIEAARAGESGRGFAVVADEVRKLAEKASVQTNEITATVMKIQQVTQIAVTSMESAGTHVTATETAMTQARAGLDSVSEHENEVVAISVHIADGTREQSAAGKEISVKVDGIVAGINHTTDTIIDVGQKAQLMRNTASNLRELISYFRIIK